VIGKVGKTEVRKTLKALALAVLVNLAAFPANSARAATDLSIDLSSPPAAANLSSNSSNSSNAKTGTNAKVLNKLNVEAGYKAIESPAQGIEIEPPPQVKVNYQSLTAAFISLNSQPTSTATKISIELPKEGRKQKGQQGQQGQAQGQAQGQGKEQQQALITVKGLCYFPHEYDIKTTSLPVQVPCTFTFPDESVAQGTLFGVLQPDSKTFALLLKPQKIKVGNSYFQVVDGYATTVGGGSQNLADEVNQKLAEKVLWAAAQGGVQSGFKAYQEYAENKNTTTYTTSDGTVVQDKSYPASYPIISAVMGAITGAVNVVSQAISQKEKSVPVIWRIYANKPFQVFLTVREIKGLR